MELNGISNTNFNGRLIVQGKGTPALKRAVYSNPLIRQYVSGTKNLLVKIQHRTANLYEQQHCRYEDDLYRIMFKKLPDDKSLFSRFLYSLRPEVCLAKDGEYHSEYGILYWLRNNKFLQKQVIDRLG